MLGGFPMGWGVRPCLVLKLSEVVDYWSVCIVEYYVSLCGVRVKLKSFVVSVY